MESAKHSLTAAEMWLLVGLCGIYSLVLAAEEIINSYENPVTKINLVPEFEYKKALAIKDSENGKLERRLAECEPHIVAAFEDMKNNVPSE